MSAKHIADDTLFYRNRKLTLDCRIACRGYDRPAAVEDARRGVDGQDFLRGFGDWGERGEGRDGEVGGEIGHIIPHFRVRI